MSAPEPPPPSDLYVFADEAGNFDFSRSRGASRYFILCTVMSRHCGAGDALLALRRDLGWRGLHLDRVFHATDDPQDVREEVFTLLAGHDFEIDATILEKPKALAHLRAEAAMYKIAWYLHFKHLASRMSKADRLFVGAASLGTKKARGSCIQLSTKSRNNYRRVARIVWRSGRRIAIPVYK